MKRFLFKMVAMVMCFVLVVNVNCLAAVETISVVGDVNNNGVLAPIDALMTLQAASRMVTFTDQQVDIGDVNWDHKITPVDALMILQACAGLTTLQYRYMVYGMNFSPYILTGQNPESTQVSEAQMHELIDIVSPYTKWIRTFNCIGDHVILTTIAHDHGLKIAVGAKLGVETTADQIVANQAQIQGLISAGLAGADLLVLGSDVLSKGLITEAQLLIYIQQIRLAVPEVRIAMADNYQEFIDHTLVVDAVDTLIARIDPFSSGIAVDVAVAFVYQKYQQVLAVAGGKPIIIESGWPSDGNEINNAIPSLENEVFFFKNLASFQQAEKISFFYAEVFDQRWKSGLSGPYWGLWNRFKSMKTGIINTFNGETVPDNWTPIP